MFWDSPENCIPVRKLSKKFKVVHPTILLFFRAFPKNIVSWVQTILCANFFQLIGRSVEKFVNREELLNRFEAEACCIRFHIVLIGFRLFSHQKCRNSRPFFEKKTLKNMEILTYKKVKVKAILPHFKPF